MSGTGATASQAWAILKRHARDEIALLRLQEMCRDNDRVSSLVTVYNSSDDQHMLMVDLSRQRMTLETLNHLLRLARAREVKQFITRLAWGPANDPNNPIVPQRVQREQSKSGYEADRGAGRVTISTAPLIPSYHLALRAPKGSEMLLGDGSNAVTAIHRDWDRIERLSDAIRRGQLPGVTGQMIRDVVVVGRGVPIMALRFVYLALCKDEMATIGRRAGIAADARRKQSGGQRRLKFVTSVDPIRVAATVADSDPGTTLVLSIALTGNEETTAATSLLKAWLLQSLGNGRRPEHVLSKHMIMVTGNERLAETHKRESVFVLPEHSCSEPFCSFTAATLLPLAIVFGWSIAEQYIQGAHDLDTHFVETNPRHNLPVLLALADVWNDHFLKANGRVVTPFAEAFAAYPGFCATLEAQTCGHSGHSGSQPMEIAPLQVIDGGLHHVYDRPLYQSATKVQPAELIMALDPQIATNAAGIADWDKIHASQDALVCSMFAHADEMAFGSNTMDGGAFGLGLLHNSNSSSLSAGSDMAGNVLETTSDGNRPSLLILCGRLDAFTCGQFVALEEHRAAVKACLWDINPFATEIGSTLRNSRMEILKERLHSMLAPGGSDDAEDDENETDPNMNLSTKTILRHYSSMMREQRVAGGKQSK